MKARSILFCALVVTASNRLATAQTRVGLIHGFHSSGATWNDFASYLGSDPTFLVPTPPDLSWSESIQYQAQSQLVPWMSSNAFDGSSILLAHSMGGLVSRQATHYYPVFGVLTIGTPHLGAAIAGGSPALLNYSATLSTYDFLINLEFQDVRNDPGNYLYPYVQVFDNDYADAMYVVLDGISIGGSFWLNWCCQSLNDMTPSGWPGADGFIDNLNGNTGLEQATQRRAIRVQLDGGYLGGPFRLVQDQYIADNTGNFINYYGNAVVDDGLEVWGHLDPDDPYYDQHEYGAFYAMDQGNEIQYFADWWHYNMVGGVPNDALIYFGAQGMPNGDTVDETNGYMHTDEPTHPLADMKQQLKTMRGF